MLSLEQRIRLSMATLDFIEKKNKVLERKISKTNDKVKLKFLLKEVQMWGKKCEAEGLIIKKLREEAE